MLAMQDPVMLWMCFEGKDSQICWKETDMKERDKPWMPLMAWFEGF